MIVIASLIFSISVGLILFISGFLKLFSLKEVSKLIMKMEIIPEKLARFIGILVPFIEIIVGILLIIANDKMIVNIQAIILIVVFISINFKAITKKKEAHCFCFGKLIKTKLGYGGLVQCLLLLLSIIPNIVFNSVNLGTLFHLEVQLVDTIAIIIASIFWTITLVLIRTILDTLLYPDGLTNS